MKILHILDHSLPLHSGYTFPSQNIFREQRKRGWEPVVLTSPKHEQSWKGEWAAKEEFDGIPYYRTGLVRKGRIPFSLILLLVGGSEMETEFPARSVIRHRVSPERTS